MKITIDASRLLTQTPTGVELYSQQIIKGLLAKSNDLIFYTPKLIPDLPKDNQKILVWPGKLWSQLRLGLELLIHPPHVFFSPGYVIPFLALFNKSTKKIVTIHDVAFIHLPRSYSFFQKRLLKLTTRQAVKHAYKIIVPSQVTKDDLIKHFNCPADKIELTYFGYTPSANQTSPKRKKQILFIGRIEHKKNIPNLIKAFEVFHKKNPDYKLILVGKPGHGFKDINYQQPGIDYLGYIPDQQKVDLLQSSACLVLVSEYEGFGFPLLEAFSYNLPVLASNIPILTEIGQSACIFVNPKFPPAIAQGLEKITQDNDLRQNLITQGQLRLKDFSWQTCIDQTLKILNAS